MYANGYIDYKVDFDETLSDEYNSWEEELSVESDDSDDEGNGGGA